MPRIVSERCVVVYSPDATGQPVSPSREVLALTRALAPYVAARPADVAATLRRCGIDPHRPTIAR